jgi:hypothetical protein
MIIADSHEFAPALARWPGHLPAAQKVGVEVRDGLAAIFSLVDHQAVSAV